MADYGALSSLKGYDASTALDRFLSYSSGFRSLKVYQSGAITGVIPNNDTGTFTADASTNTLTSSGHGLTNGELVNFLSDGTLPGGIGSFDDGYFYYVINATTNTFQISETEGGAAVDITSAGSGTHDWYTDYSKIVIYSELDYYTPWILVYNGNSENGTSTSKFMSDGSFPFSIGNPGELQIFEDRAELLIQYTFDAGLTDLPAGTTLYFTYYQFLDDFSDYTADSTGSGTNQGSEGDSYGIKASKENFDVKECDDVDLIFSSTFTMSTIHKKGITTSTQVEHDLGYIPQYLGFMKRSGNDFLSLENESIGVTNSIIECGIADASNPFYYVIFKKRTDE